MKTSDALAALAALAQESRLALYRLLVRRGPEGYPAGEISRRLDIATATLSFHLKQLSHAGLVIARRDGRFIYYSASLDQMTELVSFLTDHCCADSAASADCMPRRTSTTVPKAQRPRTGRLASSAGGRLNGSGS